MLGGRSWSTFQVCGMIGLCLGTGLAVFLALHAGLALWPLACLLPACLVTFVLLVHATRIVTGAEVLIYYHHEIAILGVSSVVLTVLGLPALPHLDVTCLGLGVFLACGRVGCLMVGCCFGKPQRWGIQYSEAHETEGFPGGLVSVPLLPVQAVESLVVLCIVTAGVRSLLQGSAPGTALGIYVLVYAAARIWLEELRGDDARRYWRGLSEAQWTSLAIMSLGLVGEWRGHLPFAPWHFALGAAAALSLLVLACTRTGRREVLHPHHACELAAILRSIPDARESRIAVSRTSLGVGVSMQQLVRRDGAEEVLYSLSRADRHLTTHEAGALARLIALLVRPCVAGTKLLQGRHGVFHFIVRIAAPERR